MNSFENINTVDDLLNMNKKDTPMSVDEICEAVAKTDVSTAKEVVMRLVGAAIGIHSMVLKEKATEDDVDSLEVIQWTRDLVQLQNAYELLSTVKM